MSSSSMKRSLSMEQMTRLVEMSENHDRPEIAKMFGVSKQSVWKYQKMFKIV